MVNPSESTPLNSQALRRSSVERREAEEIKRRRELMGQCAIDNQDDWIFCKAGAILALYLAAGIFVYCHFGGFGVLDAVYFIIVTLCTVGYGDFNMFNEPPYLQVFGILFILFGIAMAASATSALVEALLARHEKMVLEMLEKQAQQSPIKVDDPDKTKEDTARLVASLMAFVTLVLTGMLVYAYTCKLTLLQALYLVVVTASTVGYGDIAPDTTPAKAFSVFYLPLVTLSLAKCVADYSRLQMAKRTNRMRSHILKQHVNTERFEMLDQNQDQCLDKYEFLVGVLIQQSIISPGQVKEIEDRFDELDVDSSGFVTRADFSS